MASGAITKFSKFGGVLSQLVKVKPKVRFYYTYAEEPGQPMQKEPCFTTADEAVKCIKSGQLVFVHSASATPLELVKAMTDHGKSSQLKDVRVSHILTAGTAPYTDPSCDGIFRSLNFFTGANVRQAVADGRGDYVPIFVSDIPLLFYRNIMTPDVSLINVSPPDAHGFCSLGTCVDCVRAALIKSKIIIAQINPCVPRTFGDALIHQSHIDYAVPVNSPIPEFLDSASADIEAKIGKLIAENLVEDGSTLQMGVGSIPDSILSSLHNHKDLGIHSEMFSTGVVDLVEKGCVSNSKKTLHKGRIVASFMLGSKKLYDFVDNNPSIEMLRIEYVNNPHIIAQQPKMTAINSCIEVDLTGQVVADSIGPKIYSGFGGQVEFIRGAAQGLDGKGKPIIALSSTTSNGESKITPFIKDGAGVVTTRAHVHYVVTEYGIANLFGKSLRQRAHALINISHPDHREKLEKAAFDRLKCMPSA